MFKQLLNFRCTWDRQVSTYLPADKPKMWKYLRPNFQEGTSELDLFYKQLLTRYVKSLLAQQLLKLADS